MLPTATQSFCILHINVLYIFVLEKNIEMKGFFVYFRTLKVLVLF